MSRIDNLGKNVIHPFGDEDMHISQAIGEVLHRYGTSSERGNGRGDEREIDKEELIQQLIDANGEKARVRILTALQDKGVDESDIANLLDELPGSEQRKETVLALAIRHLGNTTH